MSSLRAVFVACVLVTTGAQIGAQTAEEIFTTANEKFFAGDFKAALEDFNRVLELEPTASNAYAQRGLAKLNLGDTSGARADIAAALNFDSDNPVALYARAVVRARSSNLPGALNDIEDALVVSPEAAEFHLLHAQILSALEYQDDAMAAYDKTIAYAPNHTRALAERALLHNRRRDFSAALADFDRALEIDPVYTDILDERGWAKLYLMDWEGAIADGTQSVQGAEWTSDAARLVGYAQFGIGDFANAAETLEKAATLESGSGSAYPLFIRHLALLRSSTTDDRLKKAAEGWADDEWLSVLGRFLLGEATEDDVDALAASPTDEAERTGRECEGNFYIGLARLHAGDKSTARLRFRTAIATDRTSFIEHVLARAELNRL